MTALEVVKCPDGHFRLVVWGLGPYIADYPEQVLLSCIVQGWCARYVFFCIIYYIKLIFIYKDAEHHLGSLTVVKTYLSVVHVHTQIFSAQNVKCVHCMTTTAL